jgi:hypothetical protein
MAVYRLTGRQFSRQWRRSKDYSDHEIRWLAKRRGLVYRERGNTICVTGQDGKVVVSFILVPDAKGQRQDQRR